MIFDTSQAFLKGYLRASLASTNVVSEVQGRALHACQHLCEQQVWR